MWLRRPDTLAAASAACQWWMEGCAGPASQGPMTSGRKRAWWEGMFKLPNSSVLPLFCVWAHLCLLSRQYQGLKGWVYLWVTQAWSSALYFSSFLTKNRSSGATVANSCPSTSTTDWALTCQTRKQLSVCLSHFLRADTPAAFVPESLHECLCREQSGKTGVGAPSKAKGRLA